MAVRRKRKKKWIAAVIVTALVAGTGGTVYMKTRQMKSKAEELMKVSSVRTAEVSRNTLEETVTGSGTLSADDSEDIMIPTGLILDQILVEEGDMITEGQTIATVNTASADSAVADIQSSITDIDDKLSDLSESSEEETIKATISGRVKVINIETGDEAESVLKEKGALMILSADGLMAVDLANSGAAAAGDDVIAKLTDNTEVSGIVESAAGSSITVTITDDGTGVGEEVTVFTTDGTELGKGTLMIHQPLAVTASSGEVSEIYVSDNEKVSQGDGLFYLTGVKDTVTRNELLSSRKQLTEQLSEMLEIQKNGVIVSTVSGTVSAIHVEEGETISKSSTSSSSSETATTASMSANPLMSEADETVHSGTITVSENVSSYENDASSEEDETDALLEEASAEKKNSDEKPEEDSSGSKETPSGIDEVWVPLEMPEAGTAPDDSIRDALSSAISGEPYTVYSIDWAVSENGTLDPGGYYDAVVTLVPDEGYAFSDGVSVNISGGGEGIATALSGDGSLQVQIRFTYPQEEPEPTEEPEYKPTDDPAEEVTETPYNDPTVSPSAYDDPSGSGDSSDSGSGGTSPSGSASEDSGSGNSATPTIDPSSAQGNDLQGGSTNTQNTQNMPDGVTGQTGMTGTAGSTAGAAGDMSSALSGLSGSSDGASLSGSASALSASGSTSASSADMYSSRKAAAFSVTPEEYMKVEINVDELDILSISESQAARVKLDAMGDQAFEGIVEEISKTGTNSGGSTKFAVTVKIPKEEGMLVGMSASATITTSSAENVLVIPVSAVNERGSESFVYTTQSEDGTLGGETTIETGMSTETLVEVSSGLSEGQTIYYSQLSGSAIQSDTSEADMFSMGGGDMPSGDFSGGPPSGFGGGSGGSSERPGFGGGSGRPG